MEDLKFIGNDKIPVIEIINTREELIKLLNNHLPKIDIDSFYLPINAASNPMPYRMQYYRGHSKTSYRLQSTLERYLLDIGLSEDFIKKNYLEIEAKYLDHCRKILLNQTIEGYSLLPKNLQPNELWALGQHYQMKTPLLDWSRSFFIALYFAFENHGNFNNEDEKYRVIYILNEFLFNQIKIDPDLKIGNRINAQKGVFTKKLSYELEASIERKNIYTEEGEIPTYNLSKIIISSELRTDILNFLSEINIDSTTIYPDLFGKIKNCELGIDNAILEFAFSE
ncbi:FRG domain-containing protein [Neisseria sp.]